MALQPAAGARDLNPREVDGNRWLCDQLAEVYRRWGYAEVAPPLVERLETLEAGGGIRDRELVRLASDEPLGLRPEMTASIARAACTRLASRPRPLRLWSSGAVFRSALSDVGQPRLEERLQSGVELLGADATQALVADAELLRLLLACLRQLQITADHQPTLLLGHHGILSALLDQVPAQQRLATRQALINFDPLALADLELPGHQRQGLQQLLRLRGDTKAVLYQLEQLLGPSSLLEQLAGTLNSVAAVAAGQGVRLQLDPSFQPHFDLYDGLVLKLVCQGPVAPVPLASGGRYDALVARFGGAAGGMGFSFDVEAIRELIGTEASAPERPAATLVAYGTEGQLGEALDLLEALHRDGARAELLQSPCASRADAEAVAAERGCAACHWIGS
ncbi:ATP phosphoribosyltransferase regulatory subunit [Synechococcus sp. CB0101]|uniref:ATP phosphoribosyltransferase regulatory subunit n=1 Tax=Synechococcus sp. CB0101 TaxID=232348 RepID=UPI0002001548|nr:ATP phosphoribosyltransferase regulatory subunit [Synechococcus sp. CB0101]QCH13967.1 ATP phosphoribosyltransferase regulatory subunit [Synechococcus sp. CB0101]